MELREFAHTFGLRAGTSRCHTCSVRITKGQVIAGVEAVRLRDALRRLKEYEFFAGAVSDRLKAPEDQAHELVRALIAAGLVEERERTLDRQTYGLTLAGSALANAGAGKPVSRAVARRHLESLVERAQAVNACDEYLVWVDRIVCFGSYLDESVDRVGDVDVAIELNPRFDTETFIARSRERVKLAAAAGRRFYSLFDELSWPETEVQLFLKARSAVLSFTTTNDRILEQTTTQVVYDRSCRQS